MKKEEERGMKEEEGQRRVLEGGGVTRVRGLLDIVQMHTILPKMYMPCSQEISKLFVKMKNTQSHTPNREKAKK